MASTSTTLSGAVVRLEPLEARHLEGLRAACDADAEIWRALYPFPMNGPHLDAWWERVAKDAAAGTLIAYAGVVDGAVVGCSCFVLDGANRRVEIGNTYWRPEARGGPVNPEAKRLMLAHAFRAGGLWETPAQVVQFKVDAINHRSRAAVEKLGATLDGVLRRDRITWTGRVRDTCIYSIIADAWPEVRDRLDARIAAFRPPGS